MSEIREGDWIELEPQRGRVIAVGPHNIVVEMENGLYWTVIHNESEGIKTIRRVGDRGA